MMKKNNSTSEKHPLEKKPQKKISAFFAKVNRIKLEHENHDNSSSTSYETIASTDTQTKKRKIELSPEENNKLYLKIKKSNDPEAPKQRINSATDKNTTPFAGKIDGNAIENKGSKDNLNNFDALLDFYDCDLKDFSKSIKIPDETANISLKHDHKNTMHVLKNSQSINRTIPQSNSNIENKHTKKSNEKSDFTKSPMDTQITNLHEFDDFFEEDWGTDSKLNFNTFRKCRIIDINREHSVTTLIVEDINLLSTATITCSGFWKDVQVEQDHIISVQAKRECQGWVINNDHGFVIVEPDILIPSTAIVAGLFCSRRAVLSERFRRIESLPYFTSDSSVMTIGSLVHQLLQKVLHQKIYGLSDIDKLMNEMLQSRDAISMMYQSNLSLKDCRQQMMPYVPRISQFVDHYIKGKEQKDVTDLKDNFRGKISNVCDIEENIWVPSLGIKGKVDVTVEVKIHSRKKTMPLEIKTGRPSFSLEHKGQLILYVIMMALNDENVDTGLLLYLRDNQMREIKSRHQERRDLIILRNTLASCLAQKTTNTLCRTDSGIELECERLKLPEPINHHSACAKCPYNSLCCAYLDGDQLSESHPLKTITKEVLRDVKSSHIDYVVKWISLLEMEDNSSADNTLKNIWSLSAEKRESRGTCIHDVKVVGKITERNNKYEHTFVRANGCQRSILNNVAGTEFNENEYVTVSTNNRINIASGFIVNIKTDSIVVLLDRNITKRNVNSTFHIDKYFSSTLSSFNLANVAGLLGDNEICAKLRNIVIDRKPSTFLEKLPRSLVSTSADILSRLNESQQRAVFKTLTANEYILIKGMPGTGKTQTLVGLIELLHKTGASVLVTAHTHSAVDNILLKLLDQGLDFLRLGSTTSIHPLLKQKTEEYATANCQSPESLDKVYSSKKIVGVTCYGAHHMLLRKRTFDVCVVDESAQIMQPTVLRPLYNARKFVLAGDPDQLPPIIKSNTARKLGADESLFARLDSPNNTVDLTLQYRMNKTIMDLANGLTYCNKLKTGNESVARATLTILEAEVLRSYESWINMALSSKLDDSVIVLNTGCTYNLKVDKDFHDKQIGSDQVYSNIWEVAVISRLVQAILQIHVAKTDIGIISPYRAQVNLLKRFIPKDIEINTVDQYQGRDKSIILYSCARSSVAELNKKKDFEILEDHRRLTVAITRAKYKLIVVGDKASLTRYTPFQKLFNFIQEGSVINLTDGCDDFAWGQLVLQLCDIN